MAHTMVAVEKRSAPSYRCRLRGTRTEGKKRYSTPVPPHFYIMPATGACGKPRGMPHSLPGRSEKEVNRYVRMCLASRRSTEPASGWSGVKARTWGSFPGSKGSACRMASASRPPNPPSSSSPAAPSRGATSDRPLVRPQPGVRGPQSQSPATMGRCEAVRRP